MSQAPPSWDISFFRKNAGAASQKLLPKKSQGSVDPGSTEVTPTLSFPSLIFPFGRRAPFFPAAQFCLVKLGETTRILPTNQVLERPEDFLEEGSLLLREDIDPELLERLPVLLGPQTRSHYPLPGAETYQDEEKARQEIPVLHLPGMAALFENPHKFIDRFFAVVQNRSPSELLYLPGLGDPGSYPLLVYLGVQLFDSSPLLLAARQRKLFLGDGSVVGVGKEKTPCYCPACSGTFGSWLQEMGLGEREKTALAQEDWFQQALFHNYFTGLQRMEQLRRLLESSDFRTFVEGSVAVRGELVSLLRLADLGHWKDLEPAFPLVSPFPVLANTQHSLSRPDIRRYQHRLVSRYQKAPWKELAVILPCSARKPYSNSKSHRLFTEAIENGVRKTVSFFRNNPPEGEPPFALNFPNLADRVHKLVVTSPMGLVPIELEMVSPVSDYDIPVTGDWSCQEQELVLSLLKPHLDKANYSYIIHHSNYDFLDSALEKHFGSRTFFDSSAGEHHPTSKEGLLELKEAVFFGLKTVVLGTEKAEYGNTHDNLARAFALLRNQFGDVGEALVKDSVVKGRYPRLRVFAKDGGEQLASLNPGKGLFALTMEGGQVLWEALQAGKHDKFVVETDFLPGEGVKGDIFVAGIKQASDNIRTGDEVVLVHKGKLIGVGSSLLTGEELTSLKKGKGVKVRHWGLKKEKA